MVCYKNVPQTKSKKQLFVLAFVRKKKLKINVIYGKGRRFRVTLES